MSAPVVSWPSSGAATAADLEALEGLPCGCVSVVYRTRPWRVVFGVIEAKGPYCTLAGHAVGHIVHLGDPAEAGPEEDAEGLVL